MFSIFDVSSNGQHVAQRSQTMVAQQALFLMNNPIVVDVAKDLAKQVMRIEASFAEQVDQLHLILYGRNATDGEIETLAVAFEALRGEVSESEAQRFAWQQIIHTMICANEFLHIR